MKRARLLPLLALLPLVLAAQACNSYSYVDLDIKLGGPGFNTVTIGKIEGCHMFVTGATTDDFQLSELGALCKTTNPATLDMGMFEYSTFDSGNLTFTLKLFQYPESNAACQLGVGSTTVSVGSGARATGTLTVPYMGPGCK